MQLNAFYVQFNPLPHQLDSEGSRFLDAVFPPLIELLEQYQDSKLSINLGGFCLEKLQLRKRTAWLEKIASFVGTQVELLSAPFYDLAPGLVTAERILKQLDYQVEFWKSYGVAPSSAAGIFSHYNLNQELLSALANRGLKVIIIDSNDVKNRSALLTAPDGLLVTPTTVLNLLNEHLFSERAFQYQLSQRVQLRSLALCPAIYSASSAVGVVTYLKTILATEEQGFMLPQEFAFPESAHEDLMLNNIEPKRTPAYPKAELAWLRCHEVPSVLEARAEKAKKENRRGERHGIADKFDSALRFIHQGSSRELDLENNPKAERSSTELILYGIVDLEAYLKPDIEPTIGWIEKQTVESYDFINTQLADYSVDNHGRLTELDYKPRKVSLTSRLLPPSFDLSFSVKTAPNLEHKLKSALTRKTKDLCSIRFEESQIAEFGTFGTFRELTFRAGVGAHLPNATTGFSFEYWLEGELPNDLLATVTFSFCLPSPSVEGGFIKPLLCVGGVSEKRYYLEKEKKIDLLELTGGAYGVRIIDSIEDLTMDLRSAKQIEDMKIKPVFSTDRVHPIYIGSTVSLTVKADRINGDDKSNTLFVSIL